VRHGTSVCGVRGQEHWPRHRAGLPAARVQSAREKSAGRDEKRYDMFIQRHSEREIRPDQVRAMARGLYYLAERDGITENEEQLLCDFLKEGGIDLDPESLSRAPFSIEELQHGLDTIFLRKAFLKVCILMARADGAISEEEIATLRRLSQALGIVEPLESLVEDVEGKSLG